MKYYKNEIIKVKTTHKDGLSEVYYKEHGSLFLVTEDSVPGVVEVVSLKTRYDNRLNPRFYDIEVVGIVDGDNRDEDNE